MKNLTVFGKETMRRQLRTYRAEGNRDKRTDTRRIVRCKAYVCVLFLCDILCGCTRREQLVLEMDSAAHNIREETAADTSVQTGAAPASVTENAESVRTENTGQEKPASEQVQEPENIYVHVCGAVENPGVYEMPSGSRVYEAVEEAGGFAEDADCSYVNQAQRLTDGTKLIIPTTEQTDALAEDVLIGIAGSQDEGQTALEQAGGVQGAASGSACTGAEASDGKININMASEAELCNIPGIGSTRAAAIVAYRQESGGFKKVEDIMNVSGIKEGTYNKIKDKIKVY